MKRLYSFLPLLLFWTPDGAGGGGSSGGVPLEDWIKRLNGAGTKDRKAVVEELAKALGVKIGDAYKTLKEAGWDPKNSSNKNSNNDTPPAAGERPNHDAGQETDNTRQGFSVNAEDPAAGGVTVTLRHTSPYPRYRRAGLLLTPQWKPYAVTEEQRAVLKQDTWVAFQKPAEPDKA